MLFKPELIIAIVRGEKTQTRRLVKPGEYLGLKPNGCYISHAVFDSRDRLKWWVFYSYAVQPKMGMPGVWWKPDTREWRDPRDIPYTGLVDGWQPLRIRITALRRELVQDISEADAVSEGCYWGKIHGFNGTEVNPQVQYSYLWNRINTRKGTRWDDNPAAWVISFEIARDGEQ